MSSYAQAFAGLAQALGPVATCTIVAVPCIAIYGVARLGTRSVDQIVAKAKVARYKNGDGELELRFHDIPPKQ